LPAPGRVPGGAPVRFKHINLKDEKIGNKRVKVPRAGTELDFDRAKFDGWVAKGELPNGFVFCYKFSEQVAFNVTFDSTGKVEDVEDAVTMSTLLQQ
jgi:hypothetical protein